MDGITYKKCTFIGNFLCSLLFMPFLTLFVYGYALHYRGGALAVDLSYMTYSGVLLIFICWKKLYKDTWYGK